MANWLCLSIGHEWRAAVSPGWCWCVRAGCEVFGVCPSCVICIPRHAVLRYCALHAHGGQTTPVGHSPAGERESGRVLHEQR
jgi:hypothetical protein